MAIIIIIINVIKSNNPLIDYKVSAANYYSQSTNIQDKNDYAVIKAIVNECLNEYFSRQPLNESASISTIGIKPGIIKVVDSKGNVFSGKLEKIGNTKN